MTWPSLPWWVAVFLLFGTGIYVHGDIPGQTNKSLNILNAFPQEIGEWKCDLATNNRKKYSDPNLDNEWIGVCMQNKDYEMDVYIGYIAEQRGKKRILSPRMNYPGGDARWSYAYSRGVEIPTENKDISRLHANQTLLQHAKGQKVAVLYWYQMMGQSFSNEYKYRMSLLLKNVMRKSTNAAIVRISMPVRDDSIDETFSREIHFAREIYPILVRYLS